MKANLSRLAALCLLIVLLNGLFAWEAQMHRVTASRLLAGSHAHIVARFERDGAYLDRTGAVTSEAQSYALLRAVWMDDRPAFDRSWAWTKANLLGDRALPAWLWRDGAVVDGSSAADADVDIALALLLAGDRWGVSAYTAAGAQLVRAIWRYEVGEAGGRPYLAAGPWAVQDEWLIVNPSYFAPYAYRLFAQVDPAHPWMDLLDAGYHLAWQATFRSLAGERPAGLPPDWLALRRADGALVPAPLERHDPAAYGFDAPRLYWRLALDLRWHGEPRARQLLAAQQLLEHEVRSRGFPAAVYTRAGVVEDASPTMVALAGALAVLITADPPLAARLYQARLVATAQEAEQSIWWDDSADLYGQEWAWFAVALYANALSPPGSGGVRAGAP